MLEFLEQQLKEVVDEIKRLYIQRKNAGVSSRGDIENRIYDLKKEQKRLEKEINELKAKDSYNSSKNNTISLFVEEMATPKEKTNEHLNLTTINPNEMDLDEVYDLIGNNLIDEAIEVLLQHAKGANKAEVQQLRQKWNDFNSDKIMGVLNNENRNVTSSQIVRSLLEMARKVFGGENHGHSSSSNTSVVKEVPPQGVKGVDEIRILFLAANPADTTKLSWEKEHSYIAQRLAGTNYKIIARSSLSYKEMVEAIEDFEPHIIHFVGHGKEKEIGESGQVTAKAGLAFHTEDKRGMKLISTKVLGKLFSSQKRKNPNLYLIVLNSCHSEEQAIAISNCGFYTIGTSDTIVSSAARHFAEGFYRSLQKDNNVEEALESGVTWGLSEDENIDELICLYQNGDQIFPQ